MLGESPWSESPMVLEQIPKSLRFLESLAW